MTQAGSIPILFAHYGDNWFRGSEQLLFDLLANLDRFRFEPIVWCNGEPMAEAARSLGVSTYHTPFDYYFDYDSPPFNPRRYLALVRQGAAIVHRHAIKVLHANSAAPAQWLVPIARITRRPVLAHLHIDYRRRSRFVCLLHQADLIVGVSRHVTGDFLRDGVPPARTKTIYNGIDFARLDRGEARDVRAELGIPPDTVVVTTVGSLIRRKGQDILIRAFAQLAADRDICLLIASEGPERAGYEALAAALGVAAKVRFLGYFPNLTALYQASDIIALASRADAFGLVLAEAGYYRLPAVATTVGGIPEVVEDGVTGLLVAPENPDALAAALGQLIDDPVQRRAFGQAAKERAERLFSVGQMVADFQDTYAALAQIPQSRLGWFGDAACAAPYLNAIRGLTT